MEENTSLMPEDCNQKPETAAWHANYLRQIHKYKSVGEKKKNLDKTYLNTSHNVPSWQQSEEAITSVIVKGPRLIIVHCGGKAGFIDNTFLIENKQGIIIMKLILKFHNTAINTLFPNLCKVQ